MQCCNNVCKGWMKTDMTEQFIWDFTHSPCIKPVPTMNWGLSTGENEESTQVYEENTQMTVKWEN